MPYSNKQTLRFYFCNIMTYLLFNIDRLFSALHLIAAIFVEIEGICDVFQKRARSFIEILSTAKKLITLRSSHT